MKQHERTHKGSGAGSGGGGGGGDRGVGSRGSSVVSSPVVGNTSARKGSMSTTGTGAGEGMDIDSTTASASASNPGNARSRRPQIKSELSEIMEGIDRDGGRVIEDGDRMPGVGVNGIGLVGMGEGGEEDGEGESPGLDALATAASEMS